MALPGGKYLSKRFRIRIFTFRFLIELLRCPHLTQNLENVLHWHPKFLHHPSTDSESLWLFRSACTIARIIIKIGSSISTLRCQRQSPLAMLTWAWTCSIIVIGVKNFNMFLSLSLKMKFSIVKILFYFRHPCLPWLQSSNCILNNRYFRSLIFSIACWIQEVWKKFLEYTTVYLRRSIWWQCWWLFRIALIVSESSHRRWRAAHALVVNDELATK